MFRGSYTAGSVAFLLLSTTLPAFCLRIFPQNAGRRKIGGTALAPGLTQTNRPGFLLRKPGRFVCFRGAFSGAHAKTCEGSFGKPRVCGEKSGGKLCLLHHIGSPPRMQGKADQTAEQIGNYGITPAYAGKSARHPDRPCGRRDHPRGCGEKAVATILWYSWMGSPPRMRGKD